MTTTVKENFAVFALFVCFVALRPCQPILQCRVITSILCDFYPTLGCHYIRNISKLQPQSISPVASKLQQTTKLNSSCL